MDGKDGYKKVCTSNERGTYKQAIEYHEKRLKIAKESVIGPEKEQPMEISVMLTRH